MGTRYLKIAVIYLVIGALLGMGMGIAEDFALATVHSHLLLLGWASLALAGLVYHLHPAASSTRLARWHFWLHNLGLPVFMIGLALLLSGRAWALPVTIAGSTAALVGLVLFAANVLVHVESSSPAA